MTAFLQNAAVYLAFILALISFGAFLLSAVFAMSWTDKRMSLRVGVVVAAFAVHVSLVALTVMLEDAWMI